MIFDDDTAPLPHLGMKLPEIEPHEPTNEVRTAVREEVARRAERGISVHHSCQRPYRVQAAVQRHHGIDAPIEQVVGALNALDA